MRSTTSAARVGAGCVCALGAVIDRALLIPSVAALVSRQGAGRARAKLIFRAAARTVPGAGCSMSVGTPLILTRAWAA